MEGEGKLDEDASMKLHTLSQAIPDSNAGEIMSAAIRLWYAVATGRAHVVMEEFDTAH